jgi:hypothetical protein
VWIAFWETSRLVLISGSLNLAVFTRNVSYAHTRDWLYVTINIDGNDVVSSVTLQRGILPDNTIHRNKASIVIVPDTIDEPIAFDSNSLTNSSIRVGITGDNMWVPEHILLTGPEATSRQHIPLAFEWDIHTTLSADFTDAEDPHARLSIPIRLVGLGGINTVIRRVLFLVVTSHVDDAGSPNPIVLEITAGGIPVLTKEIAAEGNRFDMSHNWYTLDVTTPFTKRDVMANGGIKLSIKGRDAWLPRHVYIFGLDTLDGRPSEMVPLVSITEWNLGWLSEDTTEGQPSVNLPVS